MSSTLHELEHLAIERLKTFEPEDGYYLGFSGGKDSLVTYHLVKKAGVTFDANFQHSSVDPPHVLRFVKSFPDVKRHKPKMTMFQIMLQKKAVPLRHWRQFCCGTLKEWGGAGRFVITGVRQEESRARSRRKFIDFCLPKRKKYLHPIIEWSDEDVWQYISENQLRYCELYDPPYNFRRVGCVGCPNAYYKQRVTAFRFFPKIKRAYMNTIQKIMDVHGKYTEFRNAHEVFEWWISGVSQNTYFKNKSNIHRLLTDVSENLDAFHELPDNFELDLEPHPDIDLSLTQDEENLLDTLIFDWDYDGIFTED